MVRLVQQTVRPDLRVVVMSATLAVEAVAAYLGGCPVVVSEGRLLPGRGRLRAAAGDVSPGRRPRPGRSTRLLDRTAGDVLVFLPGLHEIRQTARQLEPLAGERDLAVLPLHGDLPAEQQDAALLPQARRKVVLATNVAETSVTVEGVTGVVDTGLARDAGLRPGASAWTGCGSMPISRAVGRPAGRAGGPDAARACACGCGASGPPRAGRSRPSRRSAAWIWPGRCCNCSAWARRTSLGFPWLEPPPAEATVAQALALLRRLGAVGDAAA